MAERAPSIQAIMEECENGGCEIFTSELSIAEVSFAEEERSDKSLDASTDRKINELWHPSSPLQLIEFHQLIAFDAKGLIRKAMVDGWTRREQWSLKPHDAMHLATAKRHHVDAFLTYDKKLRKFGPALGFEVREPQIPTALLFPLKEPAWIPWVKSHWRCLRRLGTPRRIPIFEPRRLGKNGSRRRSAGYNWMNRRGAIAQLVRAPH